MYGKRKLDQGGYFEVLECEKKMHKSILRDIIRKAGGRSWESGVERSSYFISHLETPNPKYQITNKSQIPIFNNPNIFGILFF